MKENKSTYIGSTRFYKNLLLVIVLAVIALSVFFALYYRGQYRQLLKGHGGGTDSAEYSANADAIYYQELYPDFYAPQEYAATERSANEAFLTFNVSNYADVPDILDELSEKQVKATFFLTGTESEEDTALIRRIVEEGHSVGMLSWGQDYAACYSTVESYLADMYQIYTYLEKATGTAPTIFRFFGGSINSDNGGIYRELVAEMVRRGFVPYDWNVSLQDGQTTPTADAQVAKVQDALERMDRIVVLIEDKQDHEILMETLPRVIDAIQTAGLSLKSLAPGIKPVLFAYS